ncbi:MAG TPA: response regulator [Terriglobia bacterium]|nr:response regulator [Terriglobia bacterium]
MPAIQGYTTQRPPLARLVRILLVDEDSTDRDYYRNVLEGQGYQVRTCPSFGDALQRLLSEKFDFVVMDQGSDRFEWRAVVEHAAGPDRRTPVLVLARSHDMVRYLEAMQLGAVDYLEKPLSASQLSRVVKTHLLNRTVAA